MASILGALSAIKLFYLPGSSPVKPVKTVEPQKANAVHSQKIIAARKIKPPTAFQAEQKQQPQQEIKLQAMAPGEQKSQHTENNGLITEQKNQTVTGPTQAATPYATEKQKQLNSAIKRLKKV
ncbi:MAG: hypothetical protein KKH68_11510 [Proteobacteria bacterium]|nr:hypothetical protein [Pseudomonadota bacterium]